MQDNKEQLIKEKELYWRTIEVVQMGQEFPLFDPKRKRTQIRYSDDQAFGGMKSSIRLETGFLGKLNISIVAAPYTKDRYTMLTPFDLSLGYPLDKDDLSLQSRIVKMNRIKHEQAASISGLYLFVFVAYEDMLSNSLAQTLLQEDVFDTDRISWLHHLFLTLKFPNGLSFTARAQFNTHRQFLLFRTFFPSDTGPLPKVGHLLIPKTATGHSSPSDAEEKRGEDRSDGFDILLPFEPEKVETVRAKFLSLPDLD